MEEPSPGKCARAPPGPPPGAGRRGDGRGAPAEGSRRDRERRSPGPGVPRWELGGSGTTGGAETRRRGGPAAQCGASRRWEVLQEQPGGTRTAQLGRGKPRHGLGGSGTPGDHGGPAPNSGALQGEAAHSSPAPGSASRRSRGSNEGTPALRSSWGPPRGPPPFSRCAPHQNHGEGKTPGAAPGGGGRSGGLARGGGSPGGGPGGVFLGGSGSVAPRSWGGGGGTSAPRAALPLAARGGTAAGGALGTRDTRHGTPATAIATQRPPQCHPCHHPRGAALTEGEMGEGSRPALSPPRRCRDKPPVSPHSGVSPGLAGPRQRAG